MSSRPIVLPHSVLLCMHPDHYGEFYLPLDEGEVPCCPENDTHRVVVYGPALICKGPGE